MMGVKQRISYFADYTTTHGLPHVKRSESIAGRLFWLLVTTGAAAYVITQIIWLVIDYYNYPINVNVDIGYEFNMEFPAVTFCNLNPVRWDVLQAMDNEATQVIKDVINGKYIHEKTKKRKKAGAVGASEQVIDASALDIIYQQDAEAKAFWENYEATVDFNEPTVLQLERNIIYNAINSLPQDVQQTLGHQIYTMLIDCTYNGHRCTPSNFTYFPDPYLGNCYIFNSGFGNNTNILKSPRAGSTHGMSGLSMILYVEQDQYIPHIAPTAGFKVVVHNQSVVPMPEEDGISISPGSAEYIGIKKLQIHRQGRPYTSCRVYDESDLNIYHSIIPHSYSRSACLNSCFQKQIISKCNCFDPKLPSYEKGNATNCDLLNNLEERECYEELELQFRENSLGCVCHLPCDETSYTPTIASAHWPADVYKDAIIEQIIESGQTKIANLLKNDTTQFKTNLLSVNVYVNDLNYESINQEPAYTMLGLASDLGGQMGLWIGISLLSILEYVEILLLCLKDLVWPKSKQESTERHENGMKSMESTELKSDMKSESLGLKPLSD